ncbi:glutamate synthase-related protein [Micromonospora siamensis]|uniref:Glutamate synthase conserved region-containing protein n=1 Tax=Micromonospora siamensis TaxID=299152 RepID=A0A1C5J8Z6_9ACTN|nr:glutamate synthase-related protein [Micromonospora siamensis]SCG66721.1 glutamate synthase conserved region-containing protein [Micromonospora siamensis]
MEQITAEGFPADQVRARARLGAACAFPPRSEYGTSLVGAGMSGTSSAPPADALDALRLAPPVFMPRRLEKLIELGREPLYADVNTACAVGGFRSLLPLFVSALGSTKVSGADLGECVAEQAGRLGLPMVIGENVVPVTGYGRSGACAAGSMLSRLRRYSSVLADGHGGVAVQQSTQDADAEVWNLVYSDPSAAPLLDSGRLAFELKVGQGAKPGLGGMTIVEAEAARTLRGQFALDPIFAGADDAAELLLRSASPGTFTQEILRQQVHLMRNNFPRARIWVKLHPGRDVREAAEVCWEAGADAVTVDGAEGGSGWAPLGFLDHVGLPLSDCLRELGERPECLLVTGRMWEGARVVKALALGARAAGLGRAAFLAANEDPKEGLIRLVQCLALEIKLLVSALGKYACADVGAEDLWPVPPPASVPPVVERRQPAAALPAS